MAHSPRTAAAIMNDRNARWSVAFTAAFMNGVQAGAFFMTPTTLMPLIVADFQLSLSLSTVPIAVGKIFYILLLIPGGMLVDRFGPRRTVLAGLVSIAFIITLYATFVHSFFALILMHIFLACAASISGVPVYSIFIAQWFRDGIGLAMGLVLAGYSAAGTLVPALLGPVATASGWRVAMACMAAMLWFVAIPIAYLHLHENTNVPLPDLKSIQDTTPLLQTPPISERLPPTTPSNERVDLENWSITFTGFAMSYFLLQYCVGCFFENILFFLHNDCSMPLATASLYFSLLNLSSFIAKLLGGHLGDRYDRFHFAQAMSGLAAVAILVLFCTPSGLDASFVPQLTESPTTVLVFVIMFGFGYGGVFNALYSLVPLVFGRKHLGATQSSLFGLGLAGNAVGSVLTAVLRSHYGTYQLPFLIAAGACLTNFCSFAATRASLGGALARMQAEKALAAAIASAQPYTHTDELRDVLAKEDAIRARIGAPSPSFTSPSSSRPPSAASLRAALHPQSGFLAPSPSDFVTPEHRPLLASSLAPSPSPIQDSGVDGMRPVDGFPVARDWSSPDLRRSTRTRWHVVDSPDRGMRRSSTAGNIIRSGVLSASLESPGFLGYAHSAIDLMREHSSQALDEIGRVEQFPESGAEW